MRGDFEKLPRLSAKDRPAYQRLYDSFRRAILEQQLVAGQRLPSSRELAAFYGVARITVMQAYEQLIAEGYLEGRPGSGTYVSAELPDQFLHASGASVADEGRVVAAPSERDAGSRYVSQKPFLSGCPDLDRFPRELWLKLYSRHLRGSSQSLNMYGHGEGGYRGLRESIAAYLNTHRGVVCDAERILILSGSQPGIELVARALGGPGKVVAVENPSYRGIAKAFRMNGAGVSGVQVDDQGLVVGELAARRPAPSVVVVTPSRQFPLGTAMPVSRRAELLTWAYAKRAWVLEDDYDSEFRFRGNPLPAMQGMDLEGRTLYLGTFSRSMFPDLRIGYLVAPERIREDLLELWRTSGMSPPVAIQATLADFMREGHYLRHIRKMRQLYARRCGRLVALLEARLSDWLEAGPTDGGLHLVGYLRRKLDMDALVKRGAEKGLELFPLSRYAVGPLERDGLILGFSSYDEDALEAGVERLGEVLEELGR